MRTFALILLLVVIIEVILVTAKRHSVRKSRFLLLVLNGVYVFVGVALVVLGKDLRLWAYGGGVVLTCITFYVTYDSRLSWQCPDCHLFNEPSAFLCSCGYQLPGDGSDGRPSG